MLNTLFPQQAIGAINKLTSVSDPQNITATAVTGKQINLSWTKNVNDDNVIVAYNTTNTFGTPIDGNTYTAGNTILGGGTVIYNGIDTTYSQTSLTAQTKYYYKAWSATSGNSYSLGIIDSAATLCNAFTTPFYTQNFENGYIPSCWSQEYVSGNKDWYINTGSCKGNPLVARSGTYNMTFFCSDTNNEITKFITCPFNISAASYPHLFFWHAQVLYSTNQDSLKVYYKTSYIDTWKLLAKYINNVSSWTQRTILLPNKSDYYYIAFEAYNGGGYGVVIDDVEVDIPEKLSENTLNNINVYPNPNTGVFNIELNSTISENISIKIINILGVTVYEQDNISIVGNFTKVMELSKFDKGIYFLNVEGKSGQLIRKKIVVE